ncbi:tail protein X [Sphingosinicella sp. CPCC 101087]|uniref:tail protein X n=1 Tax=Sphingosinicella sp. CPCC 101087 TaxID=2497754 RepID=UPI00101B60F3|nr:tail protein X [Sphingosinicella sp. CPCC 101087]
MAIVTALAGEPLDALVWRVLGTSAVEPVIELNRQLAEVGPYLPEGTPVTLPEPAATPAPELELIQLWD